MNDHPADYLLDIDLAATIAAALHLQLNGGADGVTLSVTDGVVTLEGTMPDKAGRERAEQIVRTFSVAGVVNAIAVSGKHLASRDGGGAKRRRPPKSAGGRPASG